MKVYEKDEVKCQKMVEELFGAADTNDSDGIDYTGKLLSKRRIPGCLCKIRYFDGSV